MERISRRQLIRGGVAIAVGSAISFPSLLAQSPSPGSYQDIDGLAITRFDDPNFESTLKQYFPELLSSEYYTALSQYLLVVKNTSRKSIRGLQVVWHNGGTIPLINSRFVRFPDTSLRSAQRTGQKKLLSRNQVALICPLFVWRRSFYKRFVQRNGSPDSYIRSKIAQQADIYSQLSTMVATPAIKGNVIGAVYKNKKVRQTAGADIGDFYRVNRNAEHDEVLYLLKGLNVNGMNKHQALKANLSQHEKLQIPQFASKRCGFYVQARSRYATALARHMRSTSTRRFIHLLTFVRKSHPAKLSSI